MESRVVRSPYGNVHIPDKLSSTDMILQRSRLFGNRKALVDPVSEESITFEELQTHIRSYASYIHMKGLKKGDIVMFYAPNNIYYPVALYGNAYLGVISTTINPFYTPAEVQTFISDSQPVFLVTTSALLPKAKQAFAAFTCLKGIILLTGQSEGCIYISSILASGDPTFVSPVSICPKEDLYLLPYSSGTTGPSKGVMLTHYNLVANVHQQMHGALYPNLADGNTTVTFLPFYHSFAQGVVLGFALCIGTTIVVMESFDFKLYLECIQKYKATLLHLVPPTAVLLAKNPLTTHYNLSSVHSLLSGAGPIGADLEKEALQRSGAKEFRQGYGLTETSPCVLLNPVGAWKHGSSGVLLPNTEALVVDTESRKPLGPGHNGEILIRGPQVMKGYWNRPKATQESITKDGWLLTGDIGHYDEEGYFYVVDRLKELIKWKGLQVPPADLEALLLSHPAIADVAVIGIPDLEAGELPRAYVVKKPNVTVKQDDIISFVRERVSPHKRLRGGVAFMEEIPKSPSGKILRRVLRELAKQHKAKL